MSRLTSKLAIATPLLLNEQVSFFRARAHAQQRERLSGMSGENRGYYWIFVCLLRFNRIFRRF
jgi:hypothetical protein